jgi:hypothetical protein
MVNNPNSNGSNVILLAHPGNTMAEQQEINIPNHSGTNGGDGGMSDMERRVSNLETDTRAIRDSLHTLTTDVAVMKSNYATKFDIADLKSNFDTNLRNNTFAIIGVLIAGLALIAALPLYQAKSENPSTTSPVINTAPATQPPTKP